MGIMVCSYIMGNAGSMFSALALISIPALGAGVEAPTLSRQKCSNVGALILSIRGFGLLFFV